MPRLVKGTGLHGREDVDQTGMFASLGDDRLDPLLLAKGFVISDELNLQIGLGMADLGQRPGDYHPVKTVEHASELDYQIRLARDLRYLDEDSYKKLAYQVQEVRRML